MCFASGSWRNILKATRAVVLRSVNYQKIWISKSAPPNNTNEGKLILAPVFPTIAILGKIPFNDLQNEGQSWNKS